MLFVTNTLIAIIALEHVGFLILEMFLWSKPTGLKVFNMTPELAAKTATLAANQGLYNGFLAAGLCWALYSSSQDFSYSLKLFFLSCIIIAGVFGGFSVSKSILYIQATPAALAVFLLIYSSKF